MKNKTVAILLTLAMALSMAACGNGKEAEKTKESTKESSKVEESKEESKEEVQEPRLIKLIGNKTIPKVYTEKDIELADYAEQPRVQLLLEMLAEKNITLEFEPIANEQFQTTIQTRLSSGKDLPDFFNLPAAQDVIIDYGRNGILVDIGKAIDEYDEDGSIKAFWSKYYPNLMPSYCSPEGEMYSIPQNVGITVFSDLESYAGNPYGVSLRLEWLEELGIEYKNVITVEELKDILVRFREEDMNGNGLNDEVLPIDLSASNVLGYAFGISTEYNATEDKYVNMWRQEEAMKAYITYMQELLEAGVIETAGINGGKDYKNNVLAENRASGYVDFALGTWNEPLVPEEDCVFAPVHVVAEGYDTGMGLYGRQPSPFGDFVIPASCSDVEAVIDLLDVMFTEEQCYLSQYGREGIDHIVNEDTGVPQQQTTSPDFAPNLKEALGNALPVVTLAINTKEGLRSENRPQIKKDFCIWVLENANEFEIWSKDFKLPSKQTEEQAVYAEFEGDLLTYQSEVLTKLILGDLSLDNYDDYIKQMDELGMAEIDAANESRLDRYRKLR